MPGLLPHFRYRETLYFRKRKFTLAEALSQTGEETYGNHSLSSARFTNTTNFSTAKLGLSLRGRTPLSLFRHE